MVEKEEACVRRAEISEPSGNGARAFRRLVRISQVKVKLLEQPRRAQRGFISHDADALDGERKKDVGVSQRIMIEEVVRAGAEMGQVNHPSLHGNGQAD